MSKENTTQLNQLQLSARIESERKNESKYFRQFTELLKQKKDVILQKAVVDESQMKDYTKEMSIIKKIMTVERDALVGGFVVGTVTFLSVRLLPRMAIRLIGGETKMKSFRESEMAASSKPNAFLKKSGTFLFESMFAFWASWRGYNVAASMKANELADDVKNLPLIEGKSIVCEQVCPDLTKLVNETIPSEFWKNMEKDEDTLRNQESWEHILKFTQNCEKRRRFEESIRKQQGLEDDEVVVIPAPGVPDNLNP